MAAHTDEAAQQVLGRGGENASRMRRGERDDVDRRKTGAGLHCLRRLQGKGRCVFDDDPANLLIEKMEQADGLVVGSPVYYASANGSLVSLLDRAFYACGGFAGKPAAAVASARRAGTTATLDELNKSHHLRHAGGVLHLLEHDPRQHRRGGAPGCRGLQTMRNLARNMAWLLRCIEAGAQASAVFPQQEGGIRTNFIR